MPTSFCRGPPFRACVRAGSAYSESRHSVPYAEIGIRHNVATVDKFLVTDGALSFLLDDFSIQQFPHLGRRTDLAIPPRVMRIFNALNTKLKPALFPRQLATTAEQRAVDRTVFIPTELHGNAPV